nr:TPA: NADH dehydrogenase subunit 3 [Triannulata magna]
MGFMLPLMLLMLAYMLNFRFNVSRMKVSPFECGFEPNNTSRIPFSMRFYMLVIIFVVFDIEIVLLLPLPLIINMEMLTLNFMAIFFLSILLIGLLHELHEGTMNWSK